MAVLFEKWKGLSRRKLIRDKRIRKGDGKELRNYSAYKC